MSKEKIQMVRQINDTEQKYIKDMKLKDEELKSSRELVEKSKGSDEE